MTKTIAIALSALTLALAAGCTAEQATDPVEQTSDDADALTVSQIAGRWIADTGPITTIEFTKNYAETLGGGLRGKSFNATVDNGIRCITFPCPSTDDVAGVYKVSGSRLTLASYDRPSATFAKYLGDYRVTLVRGKLTLKKVDGTVAGTFHKAPGIGEEGGMCGGIAGFPCKAGLECKLDGSYPDAAGTCVKPTTGVKCGTTTCGAGLVCCNPLMNICTKPGGFCIQ